MSLTRSVTETPNEITTHLDTAKPKEIVAMFDASDEQLFDGWVLGGLSSPEFQRNFASVIQKNVVKSSRVNTTTTSQKMNEPTTANTHTPTITPEEEAL